MNRTTRILILIALWVGAFVLNPASAGEIEGRVIEVPDGGSLTVLAQRGSSIHRVRLAGIEVPNNESVVGAKARASLHRLVHGKTVRVDTNAIDAWGRLVGVASLPPAADCKDQHCREATDPAYAQLRDGQAWVEVTSLLHQSASVQKRYSEAQALAKSKRSGLWRDFILTQNNELQARPKSGPGSPRESSGVVR